MQKYNVGDSVIWIDPDGEETHTGVITGISGDIYSLTLSDDGEAEVFGNELHPSKSTVVLHDSSLSGGVVIAVEDQTAEEFAEYVSERAGLWTHFDTEDGGAILTSGDWQIDFYTGVEFDQATYDEAVLFNMPDAQYEGYWDEEESEERFRRVD